MGHSVNDSFTIRLAIILKKWFNIYFENISKLVLITYINF